MGTVTFAELKDIENLYCGTVYPNLKEYAGDSALCLFCAEWLGMQDAYWVAKAGLVGECIDLNGAKLRDMERLYPKGWQFHEADAYEFAIEAAMDGRKWDVLTLDPWSGQFQKCADLIETWTTLARKVVVLGHGNYRLTPPEAPDGWELKESIRRTDFRGGVYWMVFVKT